MKGTDCPASNCFVCDETVGGPPYECLVESYTKYSKVPVPNKISGLVGDDFLVVVDPDDVLCGNCMSLVNRMDKLDEELSVVRNILANYLSKKYKIDTAQIAGHSSEIDNSEGVEYDEFSNLLAEDQEMESETCGATNQDDTAFENPVIELTSLTGEDIIATSLFDSCDTVSCSNKKRYICSFCNEEFDTRKGCKMHIWKLHDSYYLHNDQVKYTPCLDCSKHGNDLEGLSSGSDLERTINNPIYNSDEQSQYVCNVCGKCKSEAEEIKEHFGIIILPSKMSVCHVCGEQASSESELQVHLNSHKFDSTLLSKEHISPQSSAHEEKAVELSDSSSPVSQLSAYSSSNLLKNIDQAVFQDSSENAEQKKLYVCQLCSVETANEELLKEHLKYHEELNYESELLMCSLCDERYYSRQELEEHIRSHNSTLEIKIESIHCETEEELEKLKTMIFKCNMCDKEFPSGLKLKEHKIIHTAKIGLLQCEYCLETMARKYDLMDHIKTKHSDIKMTLLCPLCNRRSGTRYALKKHVVRCHLIRALQKAFRDKYAEGLDLLDDNKESSTSDNIGEDENPDTNPKGPSHVCGICAFKCNDMTNMNNHVKCHKLKQLECSLCAEMFDTSSGLKIHMETEHKIVLHDTQCPHCLEDCGDLIENHLKQKHGEMYRYLTCFECEIIYDSKCSLKEHTEKLHLNNGNYEDIMHISSDTLQKLGILNSEQDIQITSEEVSFDEIVTGPNKEMNEQLPKHDACPHSINQTEDGEHVLLNGFECHICKKEFRSSSGLEKHFKTHSIECQDIACMFCPVKLHDKTHLSVHLKDTHPVGKKPYCVHCDKYFSQPGGYLRHKIARHSTDLTCQICGKQFSVMRKFLLHKEYFHREELSCAYCKKEFKDVKKLKVHEYIHKRNEGKTYGCDECDKTFKTASGLRFHKLGHSGNYPFFCEYCGRGFVSTHHLEEHLAKHTGEERFVCDVCGKRFQLYDTYHRHRNLHDNPYPKQCDICKQFFRNASRVAEHKRKVHTGERPYKCPFCPMTFNISSTYKVHLCIHTQKYPYNCSLCERGFTTRIKYATHLASKHGDFSLLNDKKPNYRQVFPENYD